MVQVRSVVGRINLWVGVGALMAAAAGGAWAGEAAPSGDADKVAVRGFVQFEAARAYRDPAHWSNLLLLSDVGVSGKSGETKWKASFRLEADAAYDASSVYTQDIRNVEHFRSSIRETYLDTALGDWDLRLGRQHVVWGEMVGLFVADVVSARDLRQFYLPDFDQLRIPQWAVRAEHFADDTHYELLWIPVASYDDIGRPGMDFYPRMPVVAGTATQIGTETRPDRKPGNGNWGARVGSLLRGWDVAAFAYRSSSVAPTFTRELRLIDGTPTLYYTPMHERITQVGGTFSKDLGSCVFKGEAVWTQGHSFLTRDMEAPDGVVAQRTLDYGLGVDVPFDGLRLNGQVFGREFAGYDRRIGLKRNESGVSGLVNYQLASRWETEVLLIRMLARPDWEARAKLVWRPSGNLRMTVGLDAFGGAPYGIFGQYALDDRAYLEARYSF